MIRWPVSQGGNDHWYGVIPLEIYWEDARDMAAGMMIDGMAGYLATVTSQEENDFIFNDVIDTLRNPSILDEYWLGGFDIGSEWIWITGEPWVFENWSTGEPNNVGVETALAMWGPTTVDPRRIPGKWNNALPNDEVNPLHKLWAIVEFGATGSADEVVPTDKWISIYCDAPTIDGQPFPSLGTIRAYDPGGVLCGKGAVNRDGSYGFIPIYHDDIFTDVDEGAEPGDAISLTFNRRPVVTGEPLFWTENGDVFKVCEFTTQRCLDIELHEGWNLISWNVVYEDRMEAAVADIIDSIDIVLSFDGEGLTYDPNLPEFSTLRTVDYYRGYWFRMNCAAVLEVCGYDITQRAGITINRGWNLVSYWPQVAFPTETGFSSILEYLQVAVGFDNGALVWHPDLDRFNTLTRLMPESGYWVKSSQPTALFYPVSFELDNNYNPGTGQVENLQTTAIEPARTWMSVYGEGITLDGDPLAANDHLEFFTDNGVKCGDGHYGDRGLMFTPVYGHDVMGEVSKTYPKEDDIIRIQVNGERVYPDIKWQGQGSRVSLSPLSSGEALPESFVLSQNYPNPFNPTTEIHFSIPEAAPVRLEVYNITGQKVATLVDGNLGAGTHTAHWNAADDNNRPVASGIYLYRLQAGGWTDTKKMILLK
jgi:hypothetical protein